MRMIMLTHRYPEEINEHQSRAKLERKAKKIERGRQSNIVKKVVRG